MSGIEKEVNYAIEGSFDDDSSQFPRMHVGFADHKGITAGFTLSAAIRYQLLPFAGISLQSNGLYASFSEMSYYNVVDGSKEAGDFSRKIGRIGISGAIDFCF